MGTGFIKCVLMTRDEAERSVGSVVVLAAILVIEMEEVLVARIACEVWNFRYGLDYEVDV
jgi:hypothetical protein